MKQRLFPLLFVLMICFLAEAVLAIPVARLQLQSQAGDYIGQGGNFDIIYDDVLDRVQPQIRRTLPGGAPGELLFVLDSNAPGNQFALVFVGTDALGIPIQPGVYLDAQRADFAAPGHPGLDISFQNRGSNTLTGQFTILEATFSPDQATILSLVFEFEQHTGGAAPALFGQFEYRESGLVPEPSAGVLTLLAISTVGWRVRRQSSPPSGR